MSMIGQFQRVDPVRGAKPASDEAERAAWLDELDADGSDPYMDPETVHALSAMLEGIDIARTVEELDLDAMDAAEVYPRQWAENAEWSRGYVGEYLTPLRDFYRVAATHGGGVVLWLV